MVSPSATQPTAHIPAPAPAPAADWRDQTLLQFCIQRKRALRHTLDKLAAALGLGDDAKHQPAAAAAAGEAAAEGGGGAAPAPAQQAQEEEPQSWEDEGDHEEDARDEL